MKIIIATASAMLLASCATTDPGVPSQSKSSVPGLSTWAAGNFTGLRKPAEGLAAFDLPQGPPSLDHIDYVQLIKLGPASQSVSAGYTVTSSPGTDIEPNTTGFNCPCGTPVVHDFLAVAGYSAYPESPGNSGVAFQDQRWWSIATDTLLPGSHTLTVPLDPSNWINVNGKRGDTDPTGFKAALAKIGYVGITFGASQGPAGHGISVQSGAASVTIDSLEAK